MSNKKVDLCGIIEVRFGWDAFPRQYSGGLLGGLAHRSTAIDCDARAFFCGSNGKPLSDKMNECSVSYNNQTLYESAALHSGDNQTGGVENAECIVFELERIPAEVKQIVLTVDLFKEKKSIRSGKIQEAFVRLYNIDKNEELVSVDFHNLNSGTKLVVVGRIQRSDGGWTFLSDGEAYKMNDIEEFFHCKLQDGRTE